MDITRPIEGHHYIAGEFVKGTARPLMSTNPMNDNIVWSGHHATEREIHQSLQAAQKALHPWASLSFEKRATFCERFANIVKKNQDELALQISEESGKPMWEALTEVQAVIGKIKLSIEAYQVRTSAQMVTSADATGWVRYKPHGIMVVLGPFNFPAHLSNGHIVPALLAGNTLIYKPSELTPGVAERILSYWHEAGLPPGVLQCLHGDIQTAQMLLQEKIQGVLFTGSYRGGLAIHQSMASRPEVILALEMGGNTPLVIGHTQNLNAAIYATLLSSFLSAGQRCTCARRLFVPKTHFGQQFIEGLIDATKSLKYGSYQDTPEPFMGPVISAQHANQHINAQNKLLSLGGKARLLMQPSQRSKALLSPGIIDMTSAQNIPDEEIFAPLIQMYQYENFNEALLRANQTQYGLAAGLLSDDPKEYEQFFAQIQAGIINWNRPTTGALSQLPFGGIGLSGNHRPSAYFASDYCAYPIASVENEHLSLPPKLLSGIHLESK